jgi:hypothetical protein
MKKQTVVVLLVLLLIPIATVLGGLLFSLINPEIAAGHANYARNFHFLNLLKFISILATAAVVAILWLLACFLVIRSKGRSSGWLLLAVLGPLGFAILMRLNEGAASETDRYKRFVGNLNRFVRAGYEVSAFVVLWLLAYQAIVLKRNLLILYESATTGIPTSQIIATQNASSGMWAFGEWIETMYLVAVLYIIWPIVFNLVGGVVVGMAPRKAS